MVFMVGASRLKNVRMPQELQRSENTRQITPTLFILISQFLSRMQAGGFQFIFSHNGRNACT
jgi:hypothetical protein